MRESLFIGRRKLHIHFALILNHQHHSYYDDINERGAAIHRELIFHVVETVIYSKWFSRRNRYHRFRRHHHRRGRHHRSSILVVFWVCGSLFQSLLCWFLEAGYRVTWLGGGGRWGGLRVVRGDLFAAGCHGRGRRARSKVEGRWDQRRTDRRAIFVWLWKFLQHTYLSYVAMM